MTPTEEITTRYSRIEYGVDAFNRRIGVQRLRMSQQVKVNELTPALDGDAEMTNADGETIRVARRSLPIIAASVREIDDHKIPFPRTRAELDAIMDRLDEEGMLAAVTAYRAFSPTPAENADGVVEDESLADAAKK